MDNSIPFYLTIWNGEYELRIGQNPDAIRKMASNLGAKVLYEGKLSEEKSARQIELIATFVQDANKLGRSDIQELERRLSE